MKLPSSKQENKKKTERKETQREMDEFQNNGYFSIDDVFLDGRIEGKVLERGRCQHVSHVHHFLEGHGIALTHDLLEFFGAEEIFLQVTVIHR